MSSMRGIDTPVRQRRRRVFKEVANLAYNSKNLKDDMEALPYKIVDYEESEFWESVYRDRAIIRERIRLAMGMSLRPENREHPGHLTQGLEESNIDEKYYSPPAPVLDGRGMLAVLRGVSSIPMARRNTLADDRSVTINALPELRLFIVYDLIRQRLHIIFQILGIVSQISHFLKYPSSPLSYRSIDPSHAAHITLPPFDIFLTH